MNYRYHPEARQEFDEHIDEYENKQPGLGLDFMEEVVFAVGDIIENPLAWSKIDPDIRRRINILKSNNAYNICFLWNYHYDLLDG